MFREGQEYRDFEVKKVLDIPEIKCRLIELVHQPTGAQVMHLANDDPENLFCLSFRTYPDTSNGVAHILEHTVLCGSEKFPLKDPFFSMMRRSLNTFMNALTGSDFTCYPAASQVKKDFYNLLDVYIDAVFKPKLKRFSFLQEGHRLEFSDPADPASPLEYRGIVFNEMKGAMSTMDSRMNEELNAALMPDLTYGINSGGDPKEIPNLTYEGLLEFHRSYYHPSRCLFFFYGDMPLEGHLDYIADHALANVDPLPDLEPIPRQKRFEKPVRKEAYYPLPTGEEVKGKTMISFGWLTGHISEQEDLLALTVLDSLLMDTDASLLRKALLQSGLCKQAHSCLDDSTSETTLTIHLKGCDPENADRLETVLLDELKRIVEEGIPKDRIENAIHQVEFHRSEISGDHYPFGLNLFMRAGVLKQHRANPEDALSIHSLFEKLREHIERDPRYLENKLKQFLLENSHRVRVVLKPDFELAAREEAEEREKLDAIRKQMSEEEVMRVIQQAADLSEFQLEQEEADYEVLPKVTLEDVPEETRDYPLEVTDAGHLKVFHHDCFTNGIVYADLVYDLPDFPEEDLPYLSLFSRFVSQVGCGGRSWEENLQYMQAHTGGVGAALGLHLQVEDFRKFSPVFTIHGKALHRKADYLFPLMNDMVTSLDFTDVSRLKELVVKHFTGMQSGLIKNAMSYARTLSSCGFSQASQVNNYWGGLSYFLKIRSIVEDLDPEKLSQKFCEIQQKVLGLTNPHLVLSCDREMADRLRENKFFGMQQLPEKNFTPWKGNYGLTAQHSHARDIGTPVAFTSMALQTLPYTHPDTPALKVAAQLFDNLVLHPKIREQGGAYGGGANNISNAGNFYFYAYRDPNIESSRKAFFEAVDHIANGKFDDRDLEEAKLEIIQEWDSPVSPGSRADVAYGWWREGKSKQVRQKQRDALIALTREEVIEAVRMHIQPKMADAVLVTFAGEDLIKSENLSIPIEKV